MRKYDNQNGRSMIEMLGVLAIVGVLSVAGIAGYSKAMGKYKVNKVMDQVSTIAANTKTLFASQGTYGDLDTTATARSLGLIPEEMMKTSDTRNGLNGKTFVAKTSDNIAFFIQMDGLTRDACATLLTSDWGGASGFKGILLDASDENAADGTAVASDVDKTVTPGMSATDLFNAAITCGETNTITWVFY